MFTIGWLADPVMDVFECCGIPTLPMMKMSTMSWHIFLKVSKCSLFVGIVRKSVLLHLLTNSFSLVKVHDHKEHLVVVAVVVDAELSAAPEP